ALMLVLLVLDDVVADQPALAVLEDPQPQMPGVQDARRVGLEGLDAAEHLRFQRVGSPQQRAPISRPECARADQLAARRWWLRSSVHGESILSPPSPLLGLALGRHDAHREPRRLVDPYAVDPQRAARLGEVAARIALRAHELDLDSDAA